MKLRVRLHSVEKGNSFYKIFDSANDFAEYLLEYTQEEEHFAILNIWKNPVPVLATFEYKLKDEFHRIIRYTKEFPSQEALNDYMDENCTKVYLVSIREDFNEQERV